MPTSINYPPDARGKWSLPILLALIAVAVVSFLVPTSFKPNRKELSKDKLASEIKAHLREGSFERLYDEASDSVHDKMPKEKFVRRMNVAAAKLRDVDAELNFKSSGRLEHAYREDGITNTTTSQELGEGDKAVTVLTCWVDGKFFDLYVIPGEQTPPQYAVHSVLFNLINVNGQLVEVKD